MSSKLYTLCASHISNIQRFILFDKMLESVDDQTVTIKLFVSISFDTGLENDVDNFIKKWPQHTFYKRANKISQFRHYSLLVEDLLEILCPNVGIIFTDDDDLWAPKRVETYMKCMHMHNVYTFIISNSIIKGPNLNDSIKVDCKEYYSICTTLKNAESFIIRAFAVKKLEALTFDLEFYHVVSLTAPVYDLNDIDDEVKWLYFYQYNPGCEHITM